MTDSTHPGLGIDDLLKDKREEILRLAHEHGAYNVRVFGSVARGEAGPESDVDFLVNFNSGYKMWDRIGLIQDLEDLLGRKVDVVLEKNLRDAIRDDVMQDITQL